MFSKVLIANRGLIQANCVRAVQELGAKAITIFEDEDRNSAGVRNADESYELKSSVSSRAYADIDQIVELAASLKVDAVHSGYGFLAQNAEFTKKLRQKGIVTIAPELEGAMNLANRPFVKERARRLGLPILPGSTKCQDFNELKVAADDTGYPLLLKAVHGYGGKGLKVVFTPRELKAAYNYVLSRCEKYAMNSREVFVEKYFENAHHIEFPVLRDHHKNVIIFPEQWCSVQRRFQKILVETPSRVIDAEKRKKIESIIRKVVNRLNATGFVSVVFLVDGDEIYFLKINGYIQPFYTATSKLTGVDLLKEQIRIFSGDPLKVRQENLNRNGHVISVSICAEDPINDFAPCPGAIDRFYLPFGQGINIQSNYFSGDNVATFYDPMIAKLLVRDSSRKAAIQKMRFALQNCYIDGIKTNLPLLRAIIQSDLFKSRNMNISYITKPQNRLELLDSLKTGKDHEIAAMIAALSLFSESAKPPIADPEGEPVRSKIWNSAARWINRKNYGY
ncbi:MAG: ATP-grasp domain-containing protein [Proteobacteria bacterium]|nr:ATP-grasp domain-containing protein [Pseudomonadota bacterium]